MLNIKKKMLKNVLVIGSSILLAMSLVACGGGSKSTGKTMTFGSYVQDKKDKEPIEWIVVDENSKGEITLVSKKVLINRPYDQDGNPATWNDCSLRRYLNNDFYNTAFTDEEKAKIVNHVNVNPSNSFYDEVVTGGPDTEDKVYIMSHEECLKYFSSGKDEEASFGYRVGDSITAKTTKYASENEYLGENLFVDENGNTFYWVRTPGHYPNMTSYVDSDGNITMYGYTIESAIIGVRPVINIKK